MSKQFDRSGEISEAWDHDRAQLPLEFELEEKRPENTLLSRGTPPA